MRRPAAHRRAIQNAMAAWLWTSVPHRGACPPSPGVTTSQRCTVARRLHGLAAPRHTHSTTTTIIIIIIETGHTTVAQWPTCSPTTCLLPRRSTSLHPLDCARSEGECRENGSRPRTVLVFIDYVHHLQPLTSPSRPSAERARRE